jgi:hypothetical protein
MSTQAATWRFDTLHCAACGQSYRGIRHPDGTPDTECCVRCERNGGQPYYLTHATPTTTWTTFEEEQPHVS